MGAPVLAVYAIAIGIPTRVKQFLKMGQTPLTPKLCQDEVKMCVVIEKFLARIKEAFKVIHAKAQT